jgi:tetratricopeptide (TPR) repeat protein
MEQLKIIIVVLMMGGLSAMSHAETADSAFQQGNEAYTHGQFAQAVSAYERARDQGLQHWVLYYNLGNAYYKTGALGKAVANYLRAFRLNSGQRDVINNLNLALTKAGDPLLPQDALGRLAWRAFYQPSMNALAVLASLFFIGLAIRLSLLFLGKRRLGAEPTAALIGIFLLLAVWLGLRISSLERDEGVVISGIAEVRSGPNLSDTANFTVPEGRRVLILKEQQPIQGWLEIGVPQEGLKGWVPESSVEAI